MKKCLLFLFMILSYSLVSQIEVEITGGSYCDPEPWELIFEDEFDGSSLDSDKWYSYRPIWPDNNDQAENARARSKEGQIYLDQNVVIENGLCKLRVKEENATWYTATRDYTSGMIYSKSKFRYGKIEINCKIPFGQGFWPAFWTFRANPIEEIDIFEFGGDSPHLLSTNIHSCYGLPDCSKQWWYENGDFSAQFHIIGIEWDPNCIKWYVDNGSGPQIIREETKYLKLDGTPVTECDIPAGTYLMNPHFPSNPAPLRANLAVSLEGAFTDPPNENTVFPSDYEIDHIRVYRRKICEVEDEQITISNNAVWNEDRSVDWLKVEEDQTLTINNSTINFAENGILILEEGAKLILTNSKLVSCTGKKWNGIKAENNANIIMNNSRIENAKIGVRLGNIFNGAPNIVSYDNPTLTMSHHSGIKNCAIGVYIAGLTKSKFRKDSWFTGNSLGVLAYASSGLTIDETSFHDNNEAIRSIDSYIHIRDHNYFNGGDVAISLEGTFPLSSGIDIGDEGKGFNYFLNNNKAIEAHGNESPAGANIVNCKFKEATERAVLMNGANDYQFMNNEIENTFNGVVAGATGDNFNNISCNVISNIDNVGCFYLFDNNRSTFLENHFEDDQNWMVLAANTTLLSSIGSSDEAAANCFTDNGTDMFVGDLFSFSPGQSFDYHFFDDSETDNCQEPINEGNFGKVQSFINDGYCNDEVGIFKGLVGSTTSGTVTSVNDTLYDANDVCVKCIQDSIDYWIGVVVHTGGDDPTTEGNEEVPNGDPVRPVQEEIMTEWINYGIYVAIATNNSEFGEDILEPLKKWRWQKRLFGFRILMGDTDGAQTILNGLDTSTPNRANFKTIQQINMKRLRGFFNGNYLTQVDLDQLRILAQAPYPSSGYARSIYRLFTGERLPYDLPIFDRNSATPRSISLNNKEESDLVIYPNPTNEILYLSHISSEIEKIVVQSIDGSIQRFMYFDADNNSIDVSGIQNGLYIVRIKTTEGQEFLRKFIKH